MIYHLVFVTGFYSVASTDLKLLIDPPASVSWELVYFSPVFEIGFCYAVQASLEFVILLM